MRIHPRLGLPVLMLCTLIVPGLATAQDSAQTPWLGVRLSGDTEGEGVQVGRIFVDSPADDAGLRASDVITTFAGEPVSGVQDLIRQIRSQEPGGWTSMAVMRGDDELDLDVRLGTRPEKIRDARPRVGWIGIKAIELPPSLREHFGAPEDAGVMVSEVATGSPAEAAGFDRGDVLYEVDGAEVGSIGQMRELVAGGGVGNEREFRLMRFGSEIVLESTIAVEPEPLDDSR